MGMERVSKILRRHANRTAAPHLAKAFYKRLKAWWGGVPRNQKARLLLRLDGGHRDTNPEAHR